jgi:poly-gamma-glutamate synthesis protein (capsule biosynthesis protein)
MDILIWVLTSLALMFPPTAVNTSFVPTPLSTENIITQNSSPIATLSGELIVLNVTGDLLTARSINADAVEKSDYDFPYKYINPFLKEADLNLTNLETPLTARCQSTRESTVFCGRPEHALSLSKAGIRLVSLANNHIFDQGESGASETKSILSAANIKTIDTNEPLTIKVKNITFTFISFNDILTRNGKNAKTNPADLVSMIEKYKPISDFVIVFFHWGNEYTTKITTRQSQLAHLAIDSGADLILGNHPHWVQPLEIYNQKLIAYSHGNFIFDQYWSQPTREGVLGTYYIHPQYGLVWAKYTPLLINLSGQPEIAPKSLQQKILKRLKT